MTTDFSALCAELTATLAERIDDKGDAGSYYVHAAHLLIRARAALADGPAAPAPTVMEITELSEEVEAAGLGQVDFTRAVLARWGHQPAPPADGEVAELVAELQSMATDADRRCRFSNAERFSRAADLLQRLSPPQPVPVSEQWPEFSDCDDADRVWCWSWAIGTWRLSRINQSIHTHWLPAHALPLPEVGE